MEILKTIRARRSIRKYKKRKVEQKKITAILEAGRWAPSGLNNQPWRFVVVQDNNVIHELAECTEYSKIVLDAPLLIGVFLDQKASYNRSKDLQAIGACLQNMLLACHALKLGACWLGEILNQREKVEKICGVPNYFELMAVLSIGYPDKKGTSSRKDLQKLIFRRI